MSFEHRAEHDELRATLRRFLADRSDEAAVRSAMDSERGFDEELWKALATDLGVVGIAIPEEYGGAGFGEVELHLVLEEAGRALTCSPFLSSVVLGAHLLLSSGDHDACAALLPPLAAGELTLAAVAADDVARWPGDGSAVTAEASGTQWRLNGDASFVLDGVGADRLLVLASSTAGPSLFLVDEGAEVSRESMPTLDLTRRQAALAFDGTSACLVGEPGAGQETAERTFPQARAALAAEGVGVLGKMLELSVEYAKVREQFGRPIGSFQAVKHLCASMLIRTELATSAARSSGWAHEGQRPDASTWDLVAHASVSDALDDVAADMIEVHGGIGFTWEHQAHLYYKRAVSSARLWGGAATSRAAIFQEVAR